MSALEVNKLENSAAGRALQAATQAPLSNFVDFTSNLISDVFSTLVDSTITQTKAYAELVSSVAGTVADYRDRSIGPIDTAVDRYLTEVFQPTYGATVPTGKSLTAKPAFNDSNDAVVTFSNNIADAKSAYAGVVATAMWLGSDGVTVSSGEQTFDGDKVLIVTMDSNGNPTSATIDLFNLRLFTEALLNKQVAKSFDELRAMLALGMARLVVDKVMIDTSLTFHTDSTDSDSIDSTTTTTDTSMNARNFAAGLSLGGSIVKRAGVAGSLISKSLFGNLTASYGSTNVKTSTKVAVVNEKTSAVTQLAIDITSHVKLEGHTDYFPLIPAPTPTSA